MASSSKYDVFISFSGEDTCDSFTSHLYDAVSRRKIHTFIDDRLERGDEISPALRKAIKDSEMEESEKYLLNYLRDKLISELLKEDEINMGSSCIELSSVRSRLRRTKVFIVLDDVNHFKQLDTLVGDAFKEKSSISDDYFTLSKRVICYAQCVLLTHTVLGSFLYSKSKEEWESTLEKLKVTPSMDIQNVLRISYDGLDDNEKDIFLDIACFFTGHQSPTFVESILDAYGFFTRIGLWILHDKSLICMSGYNLWMHDLLREMGRQVVREQSIKDLESTGTAIVEGIFLHNCETIEVNLSPEVFSEMNSLRLLKIYGIDKKNKCNLKFPQDLQYLPDALACLY
nr:disease resistance protein RUN1-like [Ziziphus jujuba var. spinosa]